MLYQYTKVEALEAILTNRTIRFSNLSRVNDLEEMQTKDIKDFGKTIFVSCWTKDREENFLMWKSYADNCTGVRIGLKEFPFKKYHYGENELFAGNSFDSYIDYKSVIQKYGTRIIPFFDIELVDVCYSNDDSKIIPVVKTKFGGASHMSFGRIGPNKEWGIVEHNEPESVLYSYMDLGKYKRIAYKHENETRYIMKMIPFDMVVSGLTSSKQLKEVLSMIENGQYELPQYFDFDLDQDAYDNMEIMIGPQADDKYVRSVISKLNPKAVVYNSKLKTQ